MRKSLTLPLLLAAVAATAQDSPLIIIEAESAALTPPVKVKRINGYSGNAYVGDFDQGSAIRLNHVNVNEEGPYEFRVYYTSMFKRSVVVTANSYPAVTITITKETPEWDRPPVHMMLSYIWLDKGDNTIIVTPPANDGGPNIDKFEIWETGVAMPKPEIANLTYSYDLTDDAVTITADGADAKNSAITDNDIFTIYKREGKTGYIHCELEQPHLITGYLFSEGLGASSQATDWVFEYSVDGKTYTKLNPSKTSSLGNATLFTINRQPHNDRSKAAKYYRIDTKGRDIAEIQLFGLPYINSTDNKNFPVDITEDIDTQKNTTGSPLGATGWADERYYNLFDRDMQTKYYTDESRTCYVEVEFAKPMYIERYTMTSCQDYPDRDPRSWTLEGFDTSWETISDVSVFEFPCRYATMNFGCNGTKLYRGFRLRVNENNGADRFQLLKLQLFGSETAGIDDITAQNPEAFVSPGHGSLTISSEYETQYYIYNAHGREIRSGKVSDTESVALPAGFYIVACRNTHGTVSHKIVIK